MKTETRHIVTLILTLILGTISYGQTKSYIFISKTQNADLNFLQLDNIDSFRKDSTSLRKIFEPTSGKYIVYQFIATYRGEAYNAEGPKLFKKFHDILVIQTDNTNKIIDAYQYTLEWREYPFQGDLYQNTEKGLILTDNFQLDNLKLTSKDRLGKNDKVLNDNGIIRLK